MLYQADNVEKMRARFPGETISQRGRRMWDDWAALSAAEQLAYKNRAADVNSANK